MYELVYKQSFDRILMTAAISRNFDSSFEFRSIINEGYSLSLFWQTSYCIFASLASKTIRQDRTGLKNSVRFHLWYGRSKMSQFFEICPQPRSEIFFCQLKCGFFQSLSIFCLVNLCEFSQNGEKWNHYLISN